MHEAVILVVDDEPGVLRICQRLLEREGSQTFTASSPNQALTILANKLVDLLLVDIRMPGIDGFQLITLARRQCPDLAVVVMTGYGNIETAVEALHRGVDGLVLKPFTPEELIQGVAGALRESRRKQDLFRLRALRPLFDITEVLFSETDLEKLHELILNVVCEHLKCQVAHIYRRASLTEQLVLIGQRGDVTREDIHRLVVELIEPVASGNSPLWVQQALPDDGISSLQIVLAELGLESAMCVLITTGIRQQKEPGAYVLMAARRVGGYHLKKADYEMFLILARQAGVALENAFLYNELHSSLEKLEKSQRALIQVEKMATAGRLTASIAHEINNPLQSVQNCLHLVGRNQLGSDERQKYLKVAEDELERLMSVVQRMLDYYRPGVRDRQLVEVDDLINRVLLLLEEQLRRNRINVEKKYIQPSPRVMVVQSQIQQVLLNLLINAMEAMPEGGQIYIETNCKKDHVEIMIVDNGPGIPPGEQENIFEPFVSTKENGTGLGLAVSYGIISAHGGTLEIVPVRKLGACFQIQLPLETNGIKGENR
jgi:signal transduction histidine kinase/CheY-like chemotaxis protein